MTPDEYDDNIKSCPIQASLGVLGRKWALAVLRDVVIFELDRFGDIRRNNPGMSARILSIRLTELEDAGFVSKLTDPDDPQWTRYAPTAKGQDSLPILLEFIRFGIKHHPEEVFVDGRPRELEEVAAPLVERARGQLLDADD